MDTAIDRARKTLLRMRKALISERGIRISYEELQDLDVTFLGEVMCGVEMDAEDNRQPSPPSPCL